MDQQALEVQKLEALLHEHQQDMRHRAEKGKALEAALRHARSSTSAATVKEDTPTERDYPVLPSYSNVNDGETALQQVTTDRRQLGASQGLSLAVPSTHQQVVRHFCHRRTYAARC